MPHGGRTQVPRHTSMRFASTDRKSPRNPTDRGCARPRPVAPQPWRRRSAARVIFKSAWQTPHLDPDPAALPPWSSAVARRKPRHRFGTHHGSSGLKNSRPHQSGVALRFPPHSKTRPVLRPLGVPLKNKKTAGSLRRLVFLNRKSDIVYRKWVSTPPARP